MDKSLVLKKWLQEGILKNCTNSVIRIAEENSSLQKLKQRKGFLAEYDSAIRYMYLYLLKNGYDIKIPSVHKVFRIFLIEFSQLTSQESDQIISARHMFKYQLHNVPLNIFEVLKNLNFRMSKILKTM
jgi:hypothetical protein